jgi:large subunit ribosomal protein L15
MNLENLKPAGGATKKRKRVGRGPGSGRGSTCTKGHKGQKSRKGYTSRAWFEGGQMPLQRRLPKRGFTNIHAKPTAIVNVGDLAELSETTITAELLEDRGLIRDAKIQLKVLGQGEIKSAITVRAHAFSAQATKKIVGAGGTVQVIEVPVRPKRYPKKERPKK